MTAVRMPRVLLLSAACGALVYAGAKLLLLYSAYPAGSHTVPAYSSAKPAPRAGRNWRVTWGLLGGQERVYWEPYLDVRVGGRWRPVPGPYGPIQSRQARRWWELA